MYFVSGGMETEINGAGSPTKSASSGEGVGTSSQEVGPSVLYESIFHWKCMYEHHAAAPHVYSAWKTWKMTTGFPDMEFWTFVFCLISWKIGNEHSSW